MSLVKSFATVGGLTMVSRVLGFVRDQLIAYVLGTGAVADAFIVAFRIPNLFRRLFAEGAFNSAFVPLFAERLEGEGHAKAKEFAEEAMAGLAFVLVLFTIAAIVFMPWILPLIASGFVADKEKFDLTVLLTRLAFPYLLCMSLMALYAGVLSGLRQFAAAAAAQILLNVVLTFVMGVAWWLGFSQSPAAGIILASGVTVAGVLQLALLARDSRRFGMPLKWRLPRWTPGMKRLVTLGVPSLIAGSILQLNSIIGTNIASWQEGANSFLYYADRLYQLPLGIVGVAIGVVLLPDIARLLRAGELAQVHDSQNRSTEYALLLTLPAAVALAVIPVPIITVLFQRGAFTAEAVLPTALALSAFAWGLPAFVLNKVLQPAYYAREDTKTPMRFALVNLVINSGGSIGLFFLFQRWGYPAHVGIAIATSVAAWINVAQLWWGLHTRGHYVADRRLLRNLPLILLSSLIMGGALWYAGTAMAPWFQRSAGVLVQVGALAAIVTLGVAIFALAIQLTGVADWRAFARQLRSGRRRAAPVVEE